MWIDKKEAWDKALPVIRLSSSDQSQGSALLSELGINQDDPIVCIATIQRRYFDEKGDRLNAQHHVKNYIGDGVDLSTYFRAAEYLNEMGICVLNMGLYQDHKLDPDGPIIDYANICRSPIGDIYIMARSKFFIAGGTGLFKLAAALNTPCVDANRILPVEVADPPPHKTDITIPTKFYHASKQRYLTFREILEYKASIFKRQSELRNGGIESHHNTYDEIYEAVKEMNERLSGTYQSDENDEALQNKYRALVQEYRPQYSARIGTSFIRDNQFLVD